MLTTADIGFGALLVVLACALIHIVYWCPTSDRVWAEPRDCVYRCRRLARRPLRSAALDSIPLESILWRLPVRARVLDGTLVLSDVEHAVVASVSVPAGYRASLFGAPTLVRGLLLVLRLAWSPYTSACDVVCYELDMRHAPRHIARFEMCDQDALSDLRLLHVEPGFLVVVGRQSMLVYRFATPPPPPPLTLPSDRGVLESAPPPHVYTFETPALALAAVDGTHVWRNCLLRVCSSAAYALAFVHGPDKHPVRVSGVAHVCAVDDDLLLVAYRGTVCGVRCLDDLVARTETSPAPLRGLETLAQAPDGRRRHVSRRGIDFLREHGPQNDPAIGRTADPAIGRTAGETDPVLYDSPNARFYASRSTVDTPAFLLRRPHHIRAASSFQLLLPLCALVDGYLCGPRADGP